MSITQGIDPVPPHCKAGGVDGDRRLIVALYWDSRDQAYRCVNDTGNKRDAAWCAKGRSLTGFDLGDYSGYIL
ncbi:hypothetical protein [Candidatus Manganitrophus noduliformans]|uniref:Uncharacterized protein n=1 Tax=Candidatus Manganitrophus noduliformans TaxID=2606439 RepID=A0A7X6IA58_9BACT|nr:hypothetical protein [Candidatus Manganitrophus noduliformans]NKE70193.1 hypothetical protein [Candidatus Manganitrophus noduliformans]